MDVLGSYEKLRENLITNIHIFSLVHLGTRAFEEIGGEVVQTVAWIMNKNKLAKTGKYIRLTGYNSSELKELELLNLKNQFKKIR